MLSTMSSMHKMTFILAQTWLLNNAIDDTSNWLELILDPHLKALVPIYDSQLIGMLHFVGPFTLNAHLKCPYDFASSMAFPAVGMK